MGITKNIPLSLLGCLLGITLGYAEKPTPLLLVPARDIGDERVGPFTYNMSIEKAAQRCNVTLTEPEKSLVAKEITGEETANKVLIPCKVRVRNQQLVLNLSFEGAQLRSAELRHERAIEDRSQWLQQASSLLQVLTEAKPNSTLDIGDSFLFVYPNAKRDLSEERQIKLWKGQEALTARGLLQKSRKISTVGVAWTGSTDPVLEVDARQASLQFHFSKAPEKLREQQEAQQRDKEQQDREGQKKAQQRKQWLAQRVTIPFPELKPLVFGMPKDRVIQKVKTIETLEKCSERLLSSEGAFVECAIKNFSGAPAFLSLYFEEELLSLVAVTVQAKAEPLSSFEEAKPEALRVFRYLKDRLGTIVFVERAHRELDESLNQKEATAEAVLAQLKQEGMRSFYLSSSEKNPRYPDVRMRASFVRNQQNTLLDPFFQFRLTAHRKEK